MMVGERLLHESLLPSQPPVTNPIKPDKELDPVRDAGVDEIPIEAEP